MMIETMRPTTYTIAPELARDPQAWRRDDWALLADLGYAHRAACATGGSIYTLNARGTAWLTGGMACR